jgi:hypothetical protein
MKRSLLLLVGLLTCAALAVGQKGSEAQRAHAESSFTIRLQASPSEVFPLFGPVGEGEWSPQWAPHFISPSDGAGVARGAVFSTADEHGEQIWVLTAYDPQKGRLSYCIFWPGVAVSELEIHVKKASEESSTADVLYRHTALSPEGDALVPRLAEHHGAMGPHWEHAINEALRKRRENVIH